MHRHLELVLVIPTSAEVIITECHFTLSRTPRITTRTHPHVWQPNHKHLISEEVLDDLCSGLPCYWWIRAISLHLNRIQLSQSIRGPTIRL